MAAATLKESGRKRMTGWVTVVMARCAAVQPEKLTSMVLRSTTLQRNTSARHHVGHGHVEYRNR